MDRNRNLGFYLEPKEWRTAISDEVDKKQVGRGMSVVSTFQESTDIDLTNTSERLGRLSVHMGIRAGTPTQADATCIGDALGMLVFHEAKPADAEFGSSDAMIIGWCYVDHDQFADLWQQVTLGNYSRSSLTLHLGPFNFDSPECHWDVKEQRQLFIESISFAFTRDRVEPKSEPPQKRGLFG